MTARSPARARAIQAIAAETERLLSSGEIGTQDVLMALLNQAATSLATYVAEGKEQATIDAASATFRKLFWDATKDLDVKGARYVAGRSSAPKPA
jgi:hypothetical protein